MLSLYQRNIATNSVNSQQFTAYRKQKTGDGKTQEPKTEDKNLYEES